MGLVNPVVEKDKVTHDQPKTSATRPIDPVVRGQVRMHGIIAALQSPAGHVFSANKEEYDAWVVATADKVVKYTFQE